MRDAGGEGRIVAKIERREAIDNLESIIETTAAVMVARGDLGVEVGYAELTGLQKHIISRARARNRLVITATQMMESMIDSPVPTRAEVSDVANAVLDGTDAVMLSAESAQRGHRGVAHLHRKVAARHHDAVAGAHDADQRLVLHGLATAACCPTTRASTARAAG